jgi:Zn-finger nucleic acid-binding protein
MLPQQRCPRCRTVELGPVRAGKIELDLCPDCGGVWFDARGAELRKTLEAGWEQVPEVLKQPARHSEPGRDTAADLHKQEPLLCPRCASDMTSYWYGGEAARTFVADACPLGHGTWMDSGELEKAFKALEGFSRTRAAMERSGAVDDALARAEPPDWGPRSVFSSPFWEYLAAFLGQTVHGG